MVTLIRGEVTLDDDQKLKKIICKASDNCSLVNSQMLKAQGDCPPRPHNILCEVHINESTSSSQEPIISFPDFTS